MTAAGWKSCIEHLVKTIEEHYWAADGNTEEALELVVIQFRGDDDSSESEEAFLSGTCSSDSNWND